ncbi:MAG: tRNA 2-thiouridine(34) synthase MnmA [Anaerolineales bacterium]|jgi:tRNA-specific 2-thiouridylase|nr:tRNA 2-thiouridine(34) synthase MnmA [Anaerolineales bacterium]
MTHVVVAMSGGVDSSVAAVLLKEQGYQVTGMMLRLWSEPGKEDSNRCCTPDSMSQARRVAARLDIPFYALDAKEIFRKTVVQSFLEGYAQAQTPNPCLVCNRLIRWEFLLNHALALGADFMATGHYVRLRMAENGARHLLRAVDPAKDQSYVLSILNQSQLQKALFPIGDYPKAEIRRIAGEHGLAVAKRPDSQDLCFLAGEDYRNFLKRNAPEILKAGEIVNRGGQVLGQHDGLANYTIGQRKGLGLASAIPLYVLGKSAADNRLIVGPQEQLGARALLASVTNWQSGPAPSAPFRAQIKTRYTAQPAWGLVTPHENRDQASVLFDEPQRDITPGQAAVFYDGDQVLGGGIILQSM